MKFIRDSIHGDIFLTELEFEITDTPEFQRLRRLKQLGMTFLVYPGANHTRFEHSLGVLYLAGRLAEKLALSQKETQEVRAAALLHDIGHGPLSHTSEDLLKRFLGKPHEKITGSIIENSSIADILHRSGVKPRRVVELISGGGGYLGKIISSEFDVDRMDFLVRDAHYTGVAYGIIDLDRLINTITIFKNSLAISERGLKAVEALLVAKFLMTPTVYLHHTSRIADAMFLKAMERAIEDGLLDYEMLYKLDDYDVQNVFRSSSGYVREIGERFDKRDLFKKACARNWYELDERQRNKLIGLRRNIKRWKGIEKEIADDCKLSSDYILLDVPAVPPYKETSTVVLNEGRALKIDRASPLVGILKEAQKTQWNASIYAPKEKLKKVSKVDIGAYLT